MTHARRHHKFTRRVNALIADIRPSIEARVDRLAALSIGGGNAEFVSLRGMEERTNLPIVGLRSGSMPFEPELIPLIGLLWILALARDCESQALQQLILRIELLIGDKPVPEDATQTDLCRELDGDAACLLSRGPGHKACVSRNPPDSSGMA